MLKVSIFYIPVAILAHLFVGCICVAIVANIYLFCKEVAKVKTPERFTAFFVLAVLAILVLV